MDTTATTALVLMGQSSSSVGPCPRSRHRSAGRSVAGKVTSKSFLKCFSHASSVPLADSCQIRVCVRGRKTRLVLPSALLSLLLSCLLSLCLPLLHDGTSGSHAIRGCLLRHQKAARETNDTSLCIHVTIADAAVPAAVAGQELLKEGRTSDLMLTAMSSLPVAAIERQSPGQPLVLRETQESGRELAAACDSRPPSVLFSLHTLSVCLSLSLCTLTELYRHPKSLR